MAATAAPAAPPINMQGIAVPAESVDWQQFMARTRRQNPVEKSQAYAGLGGEDVFELKKTGIISGVMVKFSGTLTTAQGTGAVATTRRWPYDLIKYLRFTANGQSNLINCSGLKLKLREMIATDDRDDRGVSNTVGAATVTQGTLATASDVWGVGSGATGITDGARAVELSWFVPVAEDEIDLHGAIFAQSSTTDLTLVIGYETAANLFALTGTATAALTGTVTLQVIRYSIPLGDNGQIVVPDLSVFHAMIQNRWTSLATGDNEIRLVGQGAGKSLLRVFYQLWNGAAPQVPVKLDNVNFGPQAWLYGGSESPERFIDGQAMREWLEHLYNSDVGGVWGFGVHEFASQHAFRDTIDMGTTSELRFLVNLLSGLALTNPGLEYVQEVVFGSGAGI
jgi:hypothetical protein